MLGQTKPPPSPSRLQWMRFTLNRLAGMENFHVDHVRTSPARTKHQAYRGLQISQSQEAVVCAVQKTLGPASSGGAVSERRDCYCLRRLIVGTPLWDVDGVRAMGTEVSLEWWLRERKPGHRWMIMHHRLPPPSPLLFPQDLMRGLMRISGVS